MYLNFSKALAVLNSLIIGESDDRHFDFFLTKLWIYLKMWDNVYHSFKQAKKLNQIRA